MGFRYENVDFLPISRLVATKVVVTNQVGHERDGPKYLNKLCLYLAV